MIRSVATIPGICASLFGCASSPVRSPIDLDPGRLEWETLAPLPLAVRAPAAASRQNAIYVVGGTSPAGRTGLLQILDVTSGEWSIGASLPVPTDWGMAAWVGDELHFLGGVTDLAPASRQHWVYDAERSAWSRSVPLPIPSAGAAVAVVGSRIFVLGGIEGRSAFSNNVLIFDVDSRDWSIGRDLPAPRINWSGAFVDGNILAVGGGVLPGQSFTGELLSYDPERNAWSQLAPLERPREALGATVARGWFCVAGGRRRMGRDIVAYRDAGCYSPTQRRWTSLPSLPEPRQELSLVAVDDRLYAIGGRDGEGHPMVDVTLLRLR